jgi:hypothetical protein
VVGRMAKLPQLLEGFNMEPSEVELREITRDLQNKKSKSQKIVQPLLSSKDPLSAEKAFEVMREIKEASRQGQSRICKLLWRLGVA